MSAQGQNLIFNLTIRRQNVKKENYYNSSTSQFHGYVDLNLPEDEAEEPEEATETLVFIVMIKQLGAKTNLWEPCTEFAYPCDPLTNVQAILDACHMIKLVRNAFGTYLVFVNSKGKKIQQGGNNKASSWQG